MLIFNKKKKEKERAKKYKVEKKVIAIYRNFEVFNINHIFLD